MLPVQPLRLCKIAFLHRGVGLLGHWTWLACNLKSLSEKARSTDQAENSDQDRPALDDLRRITRRPQQVFQPIIAQQLANIENTPVNGYRT